MRTFVQNMTVEAALGSYPEHVDRTAYLDLLQFCGDVNVRSLGELANHELISANTVRASVSQPQAQTVIVLARMVLSHYGLAHEHM